MIIPDSAKLAEYFAELQRIEEHRSATSEKEIRKLYKEMLTDLQEFLGVQYAKYAEDDKLTYSTLAKKSGYARFLEEVQGKINKISPKINKEITETVKSMYKTAYEGMVTAVSKSINNEELSKLLGEIHLTQPQVVKAAVNNPVAKLTLSNTLEKNRKQIVYNIKQTVTNGIINGDRMSTMANKIQEDVEMNYRKAMNIARTEVHRVRETGHNDASGEIDNTLADAGSPYRMVKTWKSMRDSSVRKTSKANHRKMEGQTVLQDERFELGGGVTAPCPGQSGTAYNDCRCRCYVSHDLMSDEEYFAETGKHFPPVEKQKKPYETQKKLEADVNTAQQQLQNIYGKYGVNNIEELEKVSTANFFDVAKANNYNSIIAEKQEKLEKKIAAAQAKALKKQETEIQKKVADMEKQISKADVKTYSGIWKDDVTTKDWKYKKDSIPKKQDYFNNKLSLATADADKQKWQKLLNDLADFDKTGQAYNSLETQLHQYVNQLTKIKNSGKINKAKADAFTQERRNNAIWAKSTKEADKELRAVSGEVWRNATSEERHAIYDYTKGSGKFNRPLSGFEKPWSESGTGWERKFYKGIDKVWIDFEGAGDEIRKTTELISRSTYDKDIWLQRGCNGNALESFLNLSEGTFDKMTHDDLQQFVGRDNRMYSFVSTAVSKGKGFSGSVILNIYAPKGTQMMYCEPFSHFGSGEGLKWDGISEQSSFGHESEMLIQRGASYTITKIEKTHGTTYIDMEVHPEDGYDLIQQNPSEWTGSTKNFKD